MKLTKRQRDELLIDFDEEIESCEYMVQNALHDRKDEMQDNLRDARIRRHWADEALRKAGKLMEGKK